MSKNARNQLSRLYQDPLPINVVHLPPVILHNPLSILLCLWQYLSRPTSYRIQGTLSTDTRSILILDGAHAQRLWFAGFFGKGAFSRSEPSWYIRTQRALGLIGQDERLTAEEVTARRRIARMKMKAERARLEKEELDRVRRAEGKFVAEEELVSEVVHVPEDHEQVDPIPNLEHMQLTLYEGLFLSSLDVLDVYENNKLVPPEHVQSRFQELHGDSFPIQAAVYHHYRSLGWTVKPGTKFGVDWLLYKRGPVFSHAEFALVVVPEHAKPWWWVHTLTRVNGQVKKTVILVFTGPAHDISIREVSLRRWIPSRNRD